MKKVFLTGATGNLGYATYLYLKSKGYDVLASGRNAKTHQKFDNFISFELAHEQKYAYVIGATDMIVHCAALATDNDTMQDYYVHNVKATANLLTYAQDVDCAKFVYISSPSVYFNNQHRRDVKENTVIETDKISWYAQTKWQAEQLVNASYVPSVILRPRAIFGEHDTVLMPKLLKLLQKNKAAIPLSGQVFQDFTYVENVAHAVFCAVQLDTIAHHTFNVTNHEPCYLKDILERIISYYQLNTQLKDMPDWAPSVLGVVEKIAYWSKLNKHLPITTHGLKSISTDMTLDNTSSKDTLGYTPIVDLASALDITLARYGKN